MGKKERKAFKKLEREMIYFHKKHWYQNWWGVLLISLWSGTLIAVIQIAVGVFITLK